MYETTEGSKYQATSDLDITEIAKLVRTDLKAAQVAGTLPADATFAVRISRFSGGQSLDVDITGMSDAWIYVDPSEQHGRVDEIFTAEAREATRTAARIVNAYNYDGSDIQSDYFNVRFYGHVKIQNEREQRFWAAEKARKAQRKATRR